MTIFHALNNFLILRTSGILSIMWFPLQKSSNKIINYIVCMLIKFIGALTFHNHIHETFSAFYQKMQNSFYTWIDLHFRHKDFFCLLLIFFLHIFLFMIFNARSYYHSFIVNLFTAFRVIGFFGFFNSVSGSCLLCISFPKLCCFIWNINSYILEIYLVLSM